MYSWWLSAVMKNIVKLTELRAAKTLSITQLATRNETIRLPQINKNAWRPAYEEKYIWTKKWLLTACIHLLILKCLWIVIHWLIDLCTEMHVWLKYVCIVMRSLTTIYNFIHLTETFIQSDVHLRLIQHKQGSCQETTTRVSAIKLKFESDRT